MEVSEIVRQIQQGKTELYSELWEQKKGLIYDFAKDYYLYIKSEFGLSLGVEYYTLDVISQKERYKYLEDYNQAGFLGLAKAVKYYDPEKTDGSFNALLKLCVISEFIATTAGRSSRQRKDPLLRYLSLDIPASDDDPEGPTKMDFVPDLRDEISAVDEKDFTEQLHEALEKALDMLPEKQARAIRSEYWEDRTLKQTAEEMGLTVQRVRQLRESGFKKIRSSSARRKLEQFIDQHTDYYRGTGVAAHNTRGSQVENLVLRRERLRNQYGIFFEDNPAEVKDGDTG